MIELKSDYHIHTALCRHAEGEMEDYVRRAVELGYEEIGFADHAPVSDAYDPHHRMTWDQFSTYVQTVRSLGSLYPQMKIRLGIEADIYPGFESSLRALMNAFPIDYAIAAVHFMEGEPVFFYDPEEKTDDEIREFIAEYFSRLISGVRSGLFDAIAHVDVIKWNYPDRIDFIHSQADRLFTEIRKAGMAIELNTSGLRKKPAETYPGPALIQRAAECHIPVILGSDAHEPLHVGEDFRTAKSLLLQAGYTVPVTIRGTLQAFAVR